MIYFVGRLMILSYCIVNLISTQADDETTALIKKVIEARGADKLASVQGFKIELRSFDLLGEEKTSVTGSVAVRGFDCSRIEFRTTKHHELSVFNKDRGWIRESGKTRDMTSEEISEAREGAFMSWVSMTLPTSEDGILYRLLPISKEGEQTLLGIKMSKKGIPDLEMWYDSKTFLPINQRFKFKGSDGEEVVLESRVTEHKPFNGIVIASKYTTYRNGKKYVETEVKSAEFFEDGMKLDFTKP